MSKKRVLTPRQKELRARARRAGAKKPAPSTPSRRPAAAAAPRRGQPAAGLAYHPIANAFPLIEGDEFEALVKDIKANGQREPIWLFEAMILDGRNRWRACNKAGLVPRLVEYTGDDPVGFVCSLNLRRRHLTASQRASIAAKLETFRHGGARNGASGRTRGEVAKLLNVSRGSVDSAALVRDMGSAELQEAVASGRLAVSPAALIAGGLAVDDQAALIARGEAEILKAAKTISTLKNEQRRAARVGKIRAISAGNVPLDTKQQYPVILADPPWQYPDKMGDSDRSADNHYPLMTIEEIAALPVRELATPIAILFLWITAPLTYAILPVLDAWGFEFKSEIVWDKVTPITGKRARNRHEKLLICTRGEFPLPHASAVPESLFQSKRTAVHSQKPDGIVCPMIEKMYPDLPRIYLFTREPRFGWVGWGNEAQGRNAA